MKKLCTPVKMAEGRLYDAILAETAANHERELHALRDEHDRILQALQEEYERRLAEERKRSADLEARATKGEERLIDMYRRVERAERLRKNMKRVRDQCDGHYAAASIAMRNLFVDYNPLHKRAQTEMIGTVLETLEQQRYVIAGLSDE